MTDSEIHILEIIQSYCSTDAITYDTVLRCVNFKYYAFWKKLEEDYGLVTEVRQLQTAVTVRDLMNFLSRFFNFSADIQESDCSFGSIFVPEVSNSVWFYGCNEIDSVLFPNDSLKSACRFSYKIPINEEIYYARDTGFWNNSDQGLVLTDKCIYVIPDNEDSSKNFTIKWEIVEKVEYIERILYFYDGTDTPYSISIYFFVKNADDKEATIGRFLAKLFTKLAQSQENPIDVIYNEYSKIHENEGADSALEYALKKVKDSESAYILFPEIALLYTQKEDWNNVIYYCNEGLKHYGQDSWIAIRLRDIRADGYYNLNQYDFARRDYLNTYLNAPDDMLWGEDKAKDMAGDMFDVVTASFSEHILELPYKERKIVMPVSQFAHLDEMQSVIVLGISDSCPIEYPIGHPLENQIYVGHPLIPAKYLALETYQLELIEDRVREFLFIAQCLGATEISVSCLNSNKVENDKQGLQRGGADAEHWLANVEINGNLNYSNSLINTLSRSISLHQTYQPQSEPYVPDNLVWYQTEPSWQRLVNQRMNGGLLSHKEKIETNKSQMIDNKEMHKIKAEVETFYAGLNMELSSVEKEKFQQQENAVLSIDIKFAPISECVNRQSVSPTNPIALSNLEKEYLDEYKEMIKDGNISERDKRFLEKIKKTNGISDSRAIELEEMAVPQFSPEEQEYLTEYREIICDGEISARDKRFLDKLKAANNISEARAKELESMA